MAYNGILNRSFQRFLEFAIVEQGLCQSELLLHLGAYNVSRQVADSACQATFVGRKHTYLAFSALSTMVRAAA